MTDGILLAEIQRDRCLRAYDTIIIDEAHERSLNIDFLLGYLRQLLPRRPDLKLIVTSATSTPQRFSEHFDRTRRRSSRCRGAPIRSRSATGRSRPASGATDSGRPSEQRDVDATRSRPSASSRAATAGVATARVPAPASARSATPPTRCASMDLRDTESLPLYARLSAAEQHRVFQPHRGRRIVLATNVAETSLTVPGIRYVIDTGTARITRYSHRAEGAAAADRAGVAGLGATSARAAAGASRRDLHPPLRRGGLRLGRRSPSRRSCAPTSPAVILQMTALGLGDVERFPFVEPPDKRSIRDGLALLDELGAITGHPTTSALTLTPTGRELAQLPLDPRMARMLAEAHRSGCLAEALIIVSALSIQDVRERPVEQQQAADTSHARFNVDGSDFLAYLQALLELPA